MITLSSETLRLMEELFKGRVCCLCGDQARRVTSTQKPKTDRTEHWYCHNCYPGKKDKVPPVEVKQVKVTGKIKHYDKANQRSTDV